MVFADPLGAPGRLLAMCDSRRVAREIAADLVDKLLSELVPSRALLLVDPLCLAWLALLRLRRRVRLVESCEASHSEGPPLLHKRGRTGIIL